MIFSISLFGFSESEGTEGKYFLARVTYYLGSQTSSGKRPVQGVTVAAERKYKFGHRFYIPELIDRVGGDGFFVKHDTGPDVDKRTASRGKLPVIDVYVRNPATLRKLAIQKENIFKVYETR